MAGVVALNAAQMEARKNLIEDVEWLLGGGEAPSRIARRMGYEDPNYLARKLRRCGRKDLGRLFLVRPPRGRVDPGQGA